MRPDELTGSKVVQVPVRHLWRPDDRWSRSARMHVLRDVIKGATGVGPVRTMYKACTLGFPFLYNCAQSMGQTGRISHDETDGGTVSDERANLRYLGGPWPEASVPESIRPLHGVGVVPNGHFMSFAIVLQASCWDLFDQVRCAFERSARDVDAVIAGQTPHQPALTFDAAFVPAKDERNVYVGEDVMFRGVRCNADRGGLDDISALARVRVAGVTEDVPDVEDF